MYKGSERLLYILYRGNYLPIGCLLFNSIEENTEFIETTTRYSEGWRAYKPTFQDINITFDCEIHSLERSSKAGYITLKEYKRSQTLCTLKAVNIDGSFEDIFTGYIENLTDTAVTSEAWTFSVSFKAIKDV